MACHILLVDDNEDYTDSIKDILEDEGFLVSAVNSGESACEMVRKSHFDLVLMDIKMPGMNGVETFLKMKREIPDVKVILFTAYALTELIQTAPAWSPDERHILYSMTETRNEYHRDITNVQILREDKNIETLNRSYPIRFNIYRLPFNNGDGGDTEPLEGASNNGRSNYFPRYSPDGRWVVFTISPTGIGLQPDSKLYMVPAKGGRAREMACNRGRFNSWHSWSPNGKWLIFSSKAYSPYTELFLTHIDQDGMDSPPVRLDRFSDKPYAANIPEFMNITPDRLQKITLEKPLGEITNSRRTK